MKNIILSEFIGTTMHSPATGDGEKEGGAYYAQQGHLRRVRESVAWSG